MKNINNIDVDKKMLETEFSIAICHVKCQLKTLFLAFFIILSAFADC